MRISTSGLYQQTLSALLAKQKQLAKTQQELATGNRLTRAAEDPTGAAQAQRLDHALASLGHFDRGSNLLGNRLRLQESALADAGDYLARARELAIQGNTGTLSAEDRRLIAIEVRHIRSEMLSIANRDDGNGRRLFAGQRDGVVPFTESGGIVTYAGDDGRNLVDVAPDLALGDTEPGSEIFMRPRTGDGEIRGTAAATNTGTGVLQSTRIADRGAWPAEPLRLAFTSPTTWEMRDGGGAVLSSGTYAAGGTISTQGVQVQLSGTPATGDAFDVGPAPRQDVFATLDALAAALEAPADTPAGRAALGNAVGSGLSDIATAQEHFLSIRASTGARLNSLDAASDRRADEDVSLRESLSGLRDVDYAEATTRLNLQLAAIEAAQRTMLRVQSSSLFDKL
jgi:flagellar hook-associated protein 3 FlgL